MIIRYFPSSVALLAAISFLQMSCTDSEIDSSDISEITQSIFVVPEGFYGEPYSSQYKSSDKFYVNINEKIRICGVYSINGKYATSEEAIPYYSTHKWTIDDNESSSASVYYSFNKTGKHKITLETIDFLGDTLISHATIYVNTPTKISLQSPADKYNQVNGENPDGIELSWIISGVDPWETATCGLYASYDKKNVWKSLLGETDCSNSVNLLGKLDLEVNEKGDSINHSIEPSTIYWGVRAKIQNEKGSSNQTYSDVFSFSTKLQNNGDAIIEIPVSCMFNQYPEQSRLTGTFISAAGDTLSKVSGIKANSVIRKTFKPQSNIKIVICDTIRTEYGCDSMIVDLPPSTKTITDTLFLKDNIKPNMSPVATEFSTSSPIKFFLLDNGAGINVSKNFVTINADTLQTKYEDYTLSIPNTCKKECKLIINAEDYARNKTPDVYWKIKINDSKASITGPFPKTESDK